MAELTLSQAFRQGVQEEMANNDRIFVLGTDLFDRGGHWGQLLGLGGEFGAERVRDAPISEAAMVAAGVGAALNGMRPIVDLNFMDFVFGAMDEVINQAAKIRYMWGAPVPLVIRATAGVALGGPQHNNSLEAWFAHTPGLLLVTPATPADTKGMIKTALRGEDPVIFFMHKGLSGLRGEVGGPEDLVPFGSARVVRTGGDITLVSYGGTVRRCEEAAQALAAEGIAAEVIDLRSLLPLDLETLERSVRKTGLVVVVSEAPRFGSIASEVAASISEGVFDYLDAPVLRVGAAFSPIPHSPALLNAIVPQVEDILRACGVAWARRSASSDLAKGDK